MNEKIIKILNKIIDAGFEAYVVGGFVRDAILGKESYDVDIATNAKIENLKEICKDFSPSVYYTCLSFDDEFYHFEITPYRIDGPYLEGRYPSYIKPAKNRKQDSKRRDFTINAIYMDREGVYTSYQKGLKDIKKKVIRTIGKPSIRLREDPLRILRALRLSLRLDFKIDKSLKKAILENKEKLNILSEARKKEELDEMLEIDTPRTLELLKNYQMFPVLGIPEDIVTTHNKWGFWVQLPFHHYPLKKQESKKLYSLKLLLESPLGDMDLFYASEDELQTVCEIKKIDFSLNKQKRDMLPIHDISELQIDIQSLEEKHLPITEIKENLVRQILYNHLPNTKEALGEFIRENYNK